jgi:transcriptional regulator with XRE-family HTH domain
MGCAYTLDTIGINHNAMRSTFNGIMLTLARQSRGYELEKFADKIDIRPHHLLEIEECMYQPTQYVIDKLVKYLDYPVAFFYQVTFIKEQPDKVIICGDGIQPCSFCGQVSEYLCDYPLGAGKTCSANICPQCRTHDGKYDYCPQHSTNNQYIRPLN